MRHVESPQEQPSAVATAEREEYGAPAYSEEGSAEATEVIPTHETEHTEPSAKRDED